MNQPHYTEAERLAQERGERHQQELVLWSTLRAIAARGLEAAERGDDLSQYQARMELLRVLDERVLRMAA